MAWTNDGGDHEGEDWTLSPGDTINGTHEHVGIFTIPSGTTAYYGSSAHLVIYSARANIEGTLTKSAISPVYNMSIYADQNVQVSGTLESKKDGEDGTDLYGSVGSVGSAGAAPPPPSGVGNCQHGTDGAIGATGGTGGIGSDESLSTGGHANAGGSAGEININAPRIAFSGGALWASGGQGGNGGDCRGGQGGEGGIGGQGQDGTDGNCNDCASPRNGGNGGTGGTGGTGGAGGDGGTGGDGANGGDGNDINLTLVGPESIYLSEGTYATGVGSGGLQGVSYGGSGGGGGNGGPPGAGGVGCDGGTSGSSGVTGSSGSTGTPGSAGTNGSPGSNGTVSGTYSKDLTRAIDGRKLYQASGYYGQRMRCNLITQ